MTIRRPGQTAAAIVAVSIFLIACGFGRSPQPQAGPETRDPGPPPATTAAAQTPAPVRTTARSASGTLYSRTTAQTQQRVSCSDIRTELKLFAQNGSVDWTSRVVDRWTPTSVGNSVSSVTVAPSSGTLTNGASVLVKISGSYPIAKQRFWVLFEYETSVGSAAVTFDASC
jgi:hypothetical protein